MIFRIHDQALPWTDVTKWRWPDGDKKLVKVFDHVSDIDAIMPYVKNPRVCIQAGGACGVWPLRFAQFFDCVYTFEPLIGNYKCLLFNIEGARNIVAHNAPLANDDMKYKIFNDMAERENCGAGYCVPSDNGIEAMRIDDIELGCCDLIQLDVEGFELNALQGGAKTIERHRPVIVLEEKPLPHVSGSPAAPRKWLEDNFGYKLAETIHRDVILTC